MQVRSTLGIAGATHPGLLRDSNEDRCHYDPVRGIFIVIDGVGGQAAGDTAAETALRKIRERLEQDTGPVEARILDAITSANNEVFRLAGLRPEWKGMACVLTVAVLDGDDVVVGHVGDTRCYKLRRGRIEKLTRDHSPVGEREDAGELPEAEAMRHPRRNEVYRDVGSESHRPSDAAFIDVQRTPFEPDAALLLCSDGLTDLVDSATILRTVEEYAGHAYEVVQALIEAANEAGGKDNVTVVYAEGSRFASGEDTRDLAVRRAARTAEVARDASSAARVLPASPARDARRGWRLSGLVALLVLLIAVWAVYSRPAWPWWGSASPPAAGVPSFITVPAGGAIGPAMARAVPGTEVVVEPGEYRERVVMKDGVRLRSRVPRGASIRLPGGASESDAAIVAFDITRAEVAGFRIVGDAATPLGTGVSSANAGLTLTDVEVQGAQTAAVVFDGGSSGGLLGSDVHDNPGAAVIVRSGATPRIVHNTFSANATSPRTAGPVLIETGGRPDLRANTFVGMTADAIIGLTGDWSAGVAAGNWFQPLARPALPAPGRHGRQGRGPR